MTKFYIECYYSGDTIMDDSGYYTRYFDCLGSAEDFIESLGAINDDDNFYIKKTVNGVDEPIKY